jgi:hypothetical protein
MITIKPLTKSTEKKFSPNPALPSTVLRGIIIGNSSSGKSTLLQNLFGREDLYGGIFNQKNMIILSPSLEVNDVFPMLPDAIKVSEKSQFHSTLTKLLEHVRDMARKHGKEKLPPVLVIIDDCSCVNELFTYGGVVDELFLTGRNYNISTVVVAHRLNLLSRNTKLNINFACFFPAVNYSEIESFVSQFTPKFNRKLVFEQVIETFKIPYNFVFLNTEADYDKKLRGGFYKPFKLTETEPSKSKKRKRTTNKSDEKSSKQSKVSQPD